MMDSEEQVQQRLPIPLPRVKFGSLDEFDDEIDYDETDDDETDDDAPVATPSTSDPMDSDPEVPSSSTQSLANQIHALTARFDAYWDESQEHLVVLSQDMDSIRAEMAAIRASQDKITSLSSFHSTQHHHRSDIFFFLVLS